MWIATCALTAVMIFSSLCWLSFILRFLSKLENSNDGWRLRTHRSGEGPVARISALPTLFLSHGGSKVK
jgi:hypothetical protein